MKYLMLVMFMLYFEVNMYGQAIKNNEPPKEILEQLDKMGIDNLPLLNVSESEFLNFIFKEKRKDFDFKSKKIGFIKNGSIYKKKYFDMQRKHYIDKNPSCDNGDLYIFDAVQKEASGGYDAAITYWRKFLMPINSVVKTLKRKR